MNTTAEFHRWWNEIGQFLGPAAACNDIDSPEHKTLKEFAFEMWKERKEVWDS